MQTDETNTTNPTVKVAGPLVANRARLAELAKRANELHKETFALARSTLETARACGEVLEKARLLAGHGNWMAWVAENFRGSQSTTELYRNIFNKWDLVQKHLDGGEEVGIREAGLIVSPGRKPPTEPPKLKEIYEEIPRRLRVHLKAWGEPALRVLDARWEDIIDSIGAAILKELGYPPDVGSTDDGGPPIDLPPARYKMLSSPVPTKGTVGEDYTPDLTPVEEYDGIWLKRDDLYQFNGVRGAKVRACWAIAKNAANNAAGGLVTGASQKSPQLPIVAAMAQRAGLACRVWVAKGTRYTPEMLEAEKTYGAEVCRAKATYMNVVESAAKRDAEERGWTLVPFGMKDDCSLGPLMEQVKNIPRHVKRIVITVGSGFSASGVLWGLREEKLDIPVLGVAVGKDPTDTLDVYAPPEWRKMMKVKKSSYDYEKALEARLGGVVLDPMYEAKAKEFIRPGDLLWIIGIRSVTDKTERKEMEKAHPTK